MKKIRVDTAISKKAFDFLKTEKQNCSMSAHLANIIEFYVETMTSEETIREIAIIENRMIPA